MRRSATLWMATPWMMVFIAAGMLWAGCSSCGDDGGEEGDEASASAAGSDAFEGHETHFDLVEHAHLADVDHGGTYIDFGTPARNKYTVGQWRTGWVSDVEDGDVTYSLVEETGRVFFHVDEKGPLTLRFRAKPIGSHNLTLFLNNNQQELVRMEEGNEFREYDVSIPADHVEAGENYLLLRFGGSERVGDHDVSVAVDSLRIFEGESIPEGAYTAPAWGTLLQEMAIGGDTRRAVAVQRPTTLRYHLHVPADGRLGFGVGVEGPEAEPAPVKVVVTPEGGDPVEVFSGQAGRAWNDQRVSLEQWENQIVRVDLVVEGGGSGRVGWSPVRLMVPEREEEAAPEPAKNVVVLLIDTLRADKLKAFDPSTNVETPVVDRLAQAGTVFPQAQSPENWTKPSCASIFTGLHPATHGTKTSEARLPSEALMLSEHMKAHGFSTGSFIANGYVSDRFGFDQGWDHYTNYIRESKDSDASNVFREAADWIEENKDGRFFAYVQTIDPHVPYDPPEEYLRMYDARDYDGPVQPRLTPEQLEQAKKGEITFDASDQRRLEALYDGEISQHDHEFGKFITRLEEMGVWEDTLLVITSDHGEEFNEHGSWGHGHSVYQELLNVPLLFHHPGSVPEGLRVEQTVSTIDIPGTVLTLAGVEPMPADEGVDLLPFMHGAQPSMPAVAFSDFLDDRRVIRAGRWKMILRGINATYFDLQEDPGEQNELDRREIPIAARYMRVMLGQFLGSTDRQSWLAAEQGQGLRFDTEDAEMDDTIREQLRALGYAN